MTYPNTIILASASPRRRQLLTEAGYKFTVKVSDIDESNFSSNGIASTEYAKNLAFAKANDVAQKYPQRLVIGADTIADFDGEIIGKPNNAEHAEEIIKKLFKYLFFCSISIF